MVQAFLLLFVCLFACFFGGGGGWVRRALEFAHGCAAALEP